MGCSHVRDHQAQNGDAYCTIETLVGDSKTMDPIVSHAGHNRSNCQKHPMISVARRDLSCDAPRTKSPVNVCWEDDARAQRHPHSIRVRSCLANTMPTTYRMLSIMLISA